MTVYSDLWKEEMNERAEKELENVVVEEYVLKFSVHPETGKQMRARESSGAIPVPAQSCLLFLPTTQPCLSGVQAPVPLACLHPGAVSLPGTGWEQEGGGTHTPRPTAAGGLCP